MLKILVAPASYKGSIAAHLLARAISEGCRRCALAALAVGDMHKLYGPLEIFEAPVADGGDDTLASLNQALGGELLTFNVIGPIGRPVEAAYLKLSLAQGDLAVVELAQASGIAYLTAEELSPLFAQTYGTGQMIAHAIAGGAKKIIIAVGGSASTDGGSGALSALGAVFYDHEDQPLEACGGNLTKIARIDLSQLRKNIQGIEFVVATDVISPLLGKAGAAAVFAPQKGAGAFDVTLLESGLANFAARVAEAKAISDISLFALAPGAGAAGGAGFGFASVLGAKIVSGYHYLADLLDLNQKIHWCDLVIVAEGRLDSQSLSGKGVGEIITTAARLGKIVMALPALSNLSASEIADFVQNPRAKIVVLPTANTPGKLASLQDVQDTAALGLIQCAALFEQS